MTEQELLDYHKIWRCARSLRERVEARAHTPAHSSPAIDPAPSSLDIATATATAGSDPPAAQDADWRALWIERLGPDKDPDITLAKRLAWQGWSPDVVTTVLQQGDRESPAPPLPQPPPAWLLLLAQSVRHFTAATDQPLPAPLQQVAFAPILAGFGRAGLHRLHSLAGDLWQRLTDHPACDDQIVTFLTRRLEPFAAPLLQSEFNDFRQLTNPPAAAASAGDTPLFNAFLDHNRRGAWLDLLNRFPVLARTLAELTLNAVDALIEMLQRLDRDADLLAREFNHGQPLPLIATLNPGMSDRHAGGRQVCRLRFKDGPDLHYKPHCQRIDHAFQTWLADLGTDSTTGFDLTQHLPRPHRILAQHDPHHPQSAYGWVETVAAGGFTTPESVSRYFRRTGGMLALFHVLGGRDFIMDNIIAGADGPHAIDCEALLQPLAGPAAQRAETEPGANSGNGPADAPTLRRRLLDQHEFSVRDTGMLPSWQPGAERQMHDISGLGGTGGYRSRGQVWTFSDVNTDDMSARLAAAEVPAESNLVHLHGQRQQPHRFIHEIEDGFRTIYSLIRGRVDVLSGHDGGSLADRFADSRCRFLFRATGIYGTMLQKMAAPEALQSGLRRSLEPEVLLRPFVRQPATDPPPAWTCLREESASLEQWDVPRFEVPVEFSSDTDTDTTAHLLVSPLEMARECLARLSDTDLECQLTWIRNTLRLQPVPAAPSPTHQDPDRWLQHALQLGRWLLDTTPQTFDVALTRTPCLGSHSDSHNHRDPEAPDSLHHAAAAHFLYHGHLGLAQFFAALHHATGEEPFQQRALAWLESTDHFFEHNVGDNFKSLPVGACGGLASVVHSMRLCSHLLGQPHWGQRADQLARRWFLNLAPESIKAVDVSDGLAGLALMLGADPEPDDSHAERDQNPLLLKAIAHELLRRASPTPDSKGLLWPDEDGVTTTGFAHGAAGIGAALARAGRLSGDDKLIAAAASVGRWLAHIAPLDQPADSPWPIAVTPDKTIFRPMDAWCHGTPGVLIAWCEMAHLPDAAERLPELKHCITWAAQRILTRKPHPANDLCCGNFGRIEALLSVCRLQQSLSREDQPASTILPNVRHYASTLLASRNPVGLLPVGIRESDAWLLPPGFFRGYAGIGYTMLRLYDPDSLPSQCAWDPPTPSPPSQPV